MKRSISWLLFLILLLALAGCLNGSDGNNETGDEQDPFDDDDDDDVSDDDDDDEPVDLDIEEGCNPFATSEFCVLPYPSAFFQIADPDSATGFRVNMPEDTLNIEGYEPPIDMEQTNTADGVSPSGPLVLHFALDIHPDYLTRVKDLEDSIAADSPMALFDYETGERVMFMSEMDMNRNAEYPDRYALLIRPMIPMKTGHRHIMVMTNEITDADGNSIESPYPFVVLRDNILTNNEIIEGVRKHYNEMFDFLTDQGYKRDSLMLAWDFMVASDDYLLGSVLSMREKALEMVKGAGLGYTITKVTDDPNANVARIVEGTFEVPTFLLADNSFDYDENHHPRLQAENQSFPFTMIIPKKARTLAEPIPLTIFGHGLFGSGRSYLNGWGASIIQPLAERMGMVIVATDWIGLSSGDLDLIIEHVIPDLNRISIVTDRLQQSLINNLTLQELTLGALQDDPQVKIGDNALIDDSRIYYYGVSLGGIQGSSLVSISNRITRGVLAVPGSIWMNMIPRSINWLPIKLVMDLYYPDPLLQQLGVAIFQTRFDLSDPGNLTKLMFKDPLPDAPADRRVLLQESIGDSQVPNLSTEMLARSIGIPIMTPSIYDVFGLETVTSPHEGSALVQYHLVDQAEQNPPPEENVPPSVENGVHADMVFLGHVMDQVETMVNTGRIVQLCDGPCDPD